MNEFYYFLYLSYEWIFFNKENFVYFIPLLMIFEMPILILVLIGVFKWFYKNNKKNSIIYNPAVSILVTCYNEEHGLTKTIKTIQEQIYSGSIETILVVDGAYENKKTYKLCLNLQKKLSTKFRTILVIPKWERGGLVSSANTGLSYSKNELIFRVDGDCSFDNNMVSEMVKIFRDKDIIASSGTLRVQNQNDNLLTIMQSIEYITSIQQGKTGMSNIGVLNNISGAFGVFRKNILKNIGGWDNDTAEDLDLTIRLKQYSRRNPNLKLGFQPTSINHTEVPSTIKDFLLQRIRWDGDLTFQLLKKHKIGFRPEIIGWKKFLFSFFYDIIQVIIIPILVFLYSLYILLFYNIEVFFMIFLFLYVFYVSISIFQFIIHLVLISDRIFSDLKLMPYILFYPIYLISCKYISIFAIIMIGLLVTIPTALIT